jgi:hypothetical protein
VGCADCQPERARSGKVEVEICMEAQSFQGSADGSRRRLFGELFSERLHDILWKVLMHGEQLVQPLHEVIGAFGACHAELADAHFLSLQTLLPGTCSPASRPVIG